MIIGNGLIARAFKNQYGHSKDVLIFASGVSNSISPLESDFVREKNLLLSVLNLSLYANFTIVYFSTCSIPSIGFSEISPYVKHKIEMEALVSKFQKYLIIRLPQIAGFSKNPHTLLNYLFNHISTSSRFEAWPKAMRNIIDISDVLKITKFIIDNKLVVNSFINVVNTHNHTVHEIIKCFEDITKKKALYFEKNQFSKTIVNTESLNQYLDELNITFDNNYLPNVLCKYYSSG